MKANCIKLLLLLVFVSFFAFPTTVLIGAKEGLLLWYQIILPTLLPFLILTSLIIKTNSLEIITKLVGPTICKIFKTSTQGSFAIIIGFMCGYPMGAKAIHDLYIERNISKNEAQYLLSFCNNTSPMFLISFFIYQVLCDTTFLLPSILAIYGAPIIISFFTRKIYLNKSTLKNKNISSTHPHNFTIQLFDASMIDSFTIITKIGGYIMIFSILIHLFIEVNLTQIPLVEYLLPLLEITNGITFLENLSAVSFNHKYLCMVFLITFGGLCSIAQTQCVLENTDIKILPYLGQKIITAIIAVIISFIIY